MKKIFFTLAMATAFVACNKPLTLPTDAENMKLKGTVKTLTEVTVYNSYYGQRVDTTIYQFNEKGFLTEAEKHLWKISDTDTLSENIKRTFTYKTNPNVMEMVATNGRGEVIHQLTKKMDENLLPTEITNKQKDGADYVMSSQYKGLKATSTVKSGDGANGLRADATYNADGQVLLEEFYKGDTLINKTVYTYNDKGYPNTIVGESQLGAKQKRELSFQYEYDDKGSVTQVREYQDGDLVSTSKREITYY